MKCAYRLNTTLLQALGRVLGMTNTELMEATGISNATWYRIMGNPDEITIQQLLSIANGLHFPVKRFFSNGDIDMIGSKDDYIENPYKPCDYDGEGLIHLINTCGTATWQDVANKLGITRANLRNSLLSVTRLPVVRLLAACDAFEIDPFLIIVDYNNKQVKGKSNLFPNEYDDSVYTEWQRDLALFKDLLEETKRELAEMGKKIDALQRAYDAYDEQLIPKAPKHTTSIIARILNHKD